MLQYQYNSTQEKWIQRWNEGAKQALRKFSLAEALEQACMAPILLGRFRIYVGAPPSHFLDLQ